MIASSDPGRYQSSGEEWIRPLRRGFRGLAPWRNHADGCERTLDGLGRAPVAPAEVVGTGDDQMFGDAYEKLMGEVPRPQAVIVVLLLVRNSPDESVMLAFRRAGKHLEFAGWWH